MESTQALTDPVGAFRLYGGAVISERAERSGAQLVLDTLAAEGVKVVFGYPGGAIMPLYDALFGHEVRHVLVRHEAAAAFAAGGYARSSGEVGVCIATSGPGATNLVTGLVDAMMDSVPIVAITGQVKTALMGTDAFQEADVAAITHAVTKRNIVVRNVADLVPALRAAFRCARGPRPGPVLVDIPTDVLKALASSNELAKAAPVPAVKPVPSDDAIARCIDLLRAAKRPVAIVGGGARTANALESYREFCARVRLPHTATINGLGCAQPNDPNFLGMLGMHGWKAANLAVTQADLILAFGMRFDDRVTGPPDRFAQEATIVHADIDASEFGKTVRADVCLHGDLDATLGALNNALGDSSVSTFEDWAGEAVALGGPLPRDRARAGRLSATDVLDAFFSALPNDAVVTTDVGQHQMWSAQRARPAHVRNFITSAGLGAMGFGFPAAIGAAFASEGRPVVAIVGDGGFQMSLAELATVRRYSVPVKILLIDNRNLGMVRQWQQLFYDSRYSATNLSDNPAFCDIARAYGIDAESVEDPAALPAALECFLSHPSAMMLHCACYPEENVWPMVPAGAAIHELIEAAS
ncbi:MAG: biosynthetic-type acetolactate synthase large subunit [Vulcanimicrobiaceae bacterium]